MYEATASITSRDAIRAGHMARAEAFASVLNRIFPTRRH